MLRTTSVLTIKKLARRFVVENTDFLIRSLYLQEIISMSREDDVWRRALATFFDSPVEKSDLKAFSKN